MGEALPTGALARRGKERGKAPKSPFRPSIADYYTNFATTMAKTTENYPDARLTGLTIHGMQVVIEVATCLYATTALVPQITCNNQV